ncbi:MAG: DUF3656 domain-containing U32 family peptidase [Methylocystaceae bacterium]
MELLAPAGNYQALVAAVEAGADAVYTGGKQFSARRQATNLDNDELERAVVYCHLRDRKLYLTVNTLIADSEMEAVLDYLFYLQGIGIDGVIIQDLGLVSACRQLFPDLRLHASTQMSIHNQAGVKWAQQQGLKRVVLARELSLVQIKMIQEACPQMELEVFGHGALCYSFSGQCLFSSLVGGRSGNRGNCAQPCRLPYHLQGKANGLVKVAGQHLLSPADLYLLPYLKDMETAGIGSLKIEGRMKRPEYVATVTRVYREAIDRGGELTKDELKQAEQELTAAFNRNFTPAFWHGEAENYLSPLRPNNRGILIGRIAAAKGEGAVIALKEELRLGDGIEVWTSSGGNAVTIIKKMLLDGKEVIDAPAGSRVEVELSGVAAGDRVFKTSDIDLITRAQELTQENRPGGRRPVSLFCQAQTGTPLVITIRDLISGLKIDASSRENLSAARRDATTVDQIKDKIGELGDTPFAIQNLEVEVDGRCLVPFSWIKDVRRQVVEVFKKTLLEEKRPPIVSKHEFIEGKGPTLERWINRFSRQPDVGLTVAVDRLETARAALEGGADRVYLNLAGTKGGKLDAQGLHEILAACRPGQKVLALLPRILLPGEGIIDLGPFNGVVVTNPGWFNGKADLKIGDYTLNGFNEQTVGYLLDQGLDTVCVSLELNMQQLKPLMAHFPGRLECVVHGDIPIMTSRFCLLGYTADKNSCQRCPRPCIQDEYQLVDRKGYQFPIKTDTYGRFQLFNSRTLCVIEEIPELVRNGIGSVRLQLSLAAPEAVYEITQIYRQVLNRKLGTTEIIRLKEKLREWAPSDFTKLHYYRGVI